ncbi:MAG: biopolymer transporter ExbD [Myxococcota bacterium]
MSRLKKKKTPTLMLTSLLDMFTIILIFLIVSFEAESFEFKLNPDLTLPESTARAQLRPAVNVAITGDDVVVGDDKVLTMTADGQIASDAVEGETVPALVDRLREEYEQRFGEATASELSQAAEGLDEETAEATEPIVVVQADREIEYRTLFLILRSAATAGFFKYRLAVIRS